MSETNFKEVIEKMMELKLVTLKSEILSITIEDLYDYIVNVILINNKIKDINDAAFYIMNIKVNRLYEYLNFKNTVYKKDDNVDRDLKYILEGKVD